jgi:hypothetical protein
MLIDTISPVGRESFHSDETQTMDQFFSSGLLSSIPNLEPWGNDHGTPNMTGRTTNEEQHVSDFLEHANVPLEDQRSHCSMCTSVPCKLPRLVIHASHLGLSREAKDRSFSSPLSRPCFSPDTSAVVVGTEAPEASSAQQNRLIYINLSPDPKGSDNRSQKISNADAGAGAQNEQPAETYQWWSCQLDGFVRDLGFFRTNAIVLALSRGRIGLVHTEARSLVWGPDKPLQSKRIHRDEIREMALVPGTDRVCTIGFDGQFLVTSLERAFLEADHEQLPSGRVHTDLAEIGRITIGRTLSSVRQLQSVSHSIETFTVTTDDGGLYLLDLRLPKPQAAVCLLETFREGLFAHDHCSGSTSAVALGFFDGMLCMFDLRTLRELERITEVAQKSIGDLRWCAQNRLFAFGSPTVVSWKREESSGKILPEWHAHAFQCPHHSRLDIDAFGMPIGVVGAGDLQMHTSLLAVSDSFGYLSVFDI